MRQIPNHMKEGKLIPISKIRSQRIVTINQIRPIVVKSHLSKIAEKTIIARI